MMFNKLFKETITPPISYPSMYNVYFTNLSIYHISIYKSSIYLSFYIYLPICLLLSIYLIYLKAIYLYICLSSYPSNCVAIFPCCWVKVRPIIILCLQCVCCQVTLQMYSVHWRTQDICTVSLAYIGQMYSVHYVHRIDVQCTLAYTGQMCSVHCSTQDRCAVYTGVHRIDVKCALAYTVFKLFSAFRILGFHVIRN